MSTSLPVRTHRAVIWLSAEVHGLDEFGQCIATKVHKVPQMVLSFDGEDRAITIQRLEDLIAELKGRFKKS